MAVSFIAKELMPTKTRRRKYCQRADQAPTPVNDWNTWISAAVDKFIRKNNLFYLKSGKAGNPLKSDMREELIQECWLRMAYAQQINPITERPLFKGSNNPAYLKRVIMNHLINWKVKMKPLREFDERGMPTGWKTEGISEEHETLAAPDTANATSAALDIERLATVADLNDTQMVVLELVYGFGRGADSGAKSVKAVATTLGQSVMWVRGRLTSATIRMKVVAKHSKIRQ